jgi:Uma2 family endonuclease
MVAHRQDTQTTLTRDEYLAAEETGEVKHEYRYGRVWAMAGGTQAHDTIANTIRDLLRAQLRGGPCRRFGPDMRLQVDQEIYYYPDCLITCDPADLRDSATQVERARLVVEVLSEGTEAIDRGRKLADYQRLATLEEYALVDSRSRVVEVYRRVPASRTWLYHLVKDGEELVLESIAFRCAVDLLYEDTQVGRDAAEPAG